jgi:hypothetical protein
MHLKFAFEKKDAVSLQLPSGWQVEMRSLGLQASPNYIQ